MVGQNAVVGEVDCIVFIKFHYWNLSGYSDRRVEDWWVGGEELCEVDLGVKSGMVNVQGKGKKGRGFRGARVWRWMKGKIRELYNIGRREGDGERSG